jgi:hypothetical protein
MTDMKAELEKAYRCIRGFYQHARDGQIPDRTFLGYQLSTIAAAVRYVGEDALDGSEYFIGKNVEVLQSTLATVKPSRNI